MREIKFRGFCEHENGKIVISVNGEKCKGEWIYGDLITYENETVSIRQPKTWFRQNVISKTVGQFTGLYDKNDDEIYSGHIVNFLGIVGEIVFDSGAFGIVLDCIDWDLVGHEMRKYTGCNNPLYFCCNDNFISLWEIYWNFNEEENSLGIIEIIGNIHDREENHGQTMER